MSDANGPRKAWMLFKGPEVKGFKFGVVRTPAEVDIASLPAEQRARPRDRAIGWAAALTQAELDDGWDATPVAFYRLPVLLDDLAAAAPKIEGRTLVSNGLRYHLDDRGRAHPGGLDPLAPEPEIVDEAALLAAVQRRNQSEVDRLEAAHELETGAKLPPLKKQRLLAQPVEFLERGTLRRVRVLPPAPGQPGAVEKA